MSKIKTFLLMLPFLGLCGWAMYYTHLVKNATEVILPITGYDPRNLLSGHYIEFDINWLGADCYQANWNGRCPKKDFAGINRYYVPENQAKKLEGMIGNVNYVAEIVFAYQDKSKPVAKELLINGIPYQEIGKKKKKTGSLISLFRSKKIESEANEIIHLGAKISMIAQTKNAGQGGYADLEDLGFFNTEMACIHSYEDIASEDGKIVRIYLRADCQDMAQKIQEIAADQVVDGECQVGSKCLIQFGY